MRYVPNLKESFIFYMSTINLESDRTLDFLKKIADNRVLSVWYVACMPGVRPLL